MDIHCPAVTDIVPAPNALQQELTREHLAAVLGEEQQQIVLLRLERQYLPSQGDLAAGQVDLQVPEGQDLLGSRSHL